ncbi:15287_t:CDS:2 [Dentiscutata erythropus]|uniref:15287_t:CDS:1 n=1 Tax=Dentiscutata erythropus TaxID=1348616 RepID=A0A9N9BAM4_9GLOM|nr:15287_t:CDS:2 [Dentiscutata erythropus]
MCKNLISDCVLIPSIISNSNSVFYGVKPKAWTNDEIIIDIAKDQSDFDLKDNKDEDSDDEIDESDNITEQTTQDTVLKWCIIYTDGRKSMTSEADNLLIHLVIISTTQHGIPSQTMPKR